MQVFAVFGMADSEEVFKRAQLRFPHHYRQIDSAVFLVAAVGMTTQDVAVQLGVTEERGIVFAMGAYYGFHDRGTWEWIDLMAKS